MRGEHQVATVHRSLGTDVSAQRNRRARLQQHRLALPARRRKRLSRLRNASARIGHLLRAGPTAVALWGTFQGLAPGQLHALRQRQLRAETSSSIGLSTNAKRTRGAAPRPIRSRLLESH
eukprot:4743201-Amphidinium_carterae.2